MPALIGTSKVWYLQVHDPGMSCLFSWFWGSCPDPFMFFIFQEVCYLLCQKIILYEANFGNLDRGWRLREQHRGSDLRDLTHWAFWEILNQVSNCISGCRVPVMQMMSVSHWKPSGGFSLYPNSKHLTLVLACSPGLTSRARCLPHRPSSCSSHANQPHFGPFSVTMSTQILLSSHFVGAGSFLLSDPSLNVTSSGSTSLTTQSTICLYNMILFSFSTEHSTLWYFSSLFLDFCLY